VPSWQRRGKEAFALGVVYDLNPIGISSEQKAFADLRESNGGGIGDLINLEASKICMDLE